MAGFRVNTATLRSEAEKLKNLDEQFKNKITDLQQKENALSGMWEGQARDAFHNAFTQDYNQFINFYNGILQFVDRLNDAAKKYDEAENQNFETASVRK